MNHTALEQLDEQLRLLSVARSVFPKLPASVRGETVVATAEHFRAQGLDVVLSFGAPLTEGNIRSYNELAHWLNQNFIVRLYAVMEANGFVSETVSIRQDLPGADRLDILRRLRRLIAHGSGHYDPTNGDKVRLRERIEATFSLEPSHDPEDSDKFPLGIRQVLIPLVEGCKQYVAAIGRAA